MAATPVVGSSSEKISLKQVSKVFGTFAALRNVTADFACGRIYVILGENGAGKSTLLRVLSGLMRKTRGEIQLPGIATEKDSSHAHIGYMAHSSMLYDEFSAIENLRYFAALYGLSLKEAQQSASQTAAGGAGLWIGPENSLRAVGLDPHLPRPVGQYSQGMRQRVSLARAIQHDPTLVLLDEPFSNVDAESARRMIALIVAMRDAQRTVILTTHQPALVEGVADEFITMAAGAIITREPGRIPGAPR